MASTKTTDLSAVTTPQDTDILMIVDVDDTTMASSGTNKKITVANLLGGATQAKMAYADGLTSDMQAQSDAIGAASGTFTNITGNAIANGVIATTQSSSNNSTKIATTAYVDGAGLGGGGTFSECTGRLTGESAKYVSTSDQASVSTLYFCGPLGTKFRTWLWGGSTYAATVYDQISLDVSALTTGKPYDIFMHDNSGTPTLSAVAWTNDTIRATTLTMDSLGILHKTGAQTHRYLGTIYTTGVSVITVDSAATRYIWNYYNRMSRKIVGMPSATSYSYGSGADTVTRAANNNTTLGQGYRVGWVQGLTNFEAVELAVYGWTGENGYQAPAEWAAMGIGIDSATVNSAQLVNSAHCEIYGNGDTMDARYVGYPGIGLHYGQWLETTAKSPDCGAYCGSTHGNLLFRVGTATDYQFGMLGKIYG